MVVRYYSSVATETTLVGSITNANTSIEVASVTGFPALTPYTLVLDYETSTEELVQVNAAAGTTLTVDRAVDGTSAAAHGSGARVRHVSSARDFADSRTHENSDEGIHGLAPGDELVGADATQTLSNKTLNMATGTLNRIDIFNSAVGGPWITTLNGDTSNTQDLMRFNRGSAEPHPVLSVSNNGALVVRNQNAAADSVPGTYRIRVVKDNGSTDIFSVLQSGQVVAWLTSGSAGFTAASPASGAAIPAFQVLDSAGAVRRTAIYTDGRTDIQGTDPAVSQLDVIAATAQSAAISRVLDPTQAVVYNATDSTGRFLANSSSTIANTNGGAAVVPLIVGANTTSQTGNLTNWVGQSGATVASITAAGVADFAITNTSTGIITAATGWGIQAQQAIVKGGTVTLVFAMERTGASLPGGADGNLGDTPVGTIAAAFRPNAAFSANTITTIGTTGSGDGAVRLSPTTGLVEIVTFSSNGTLATTQFLRFNFTYAL